MTENTLHAALDETAALRDSVRAFVQVKSPESEVRRLLETEHGFDQDVWSQMQQQLELQAMTIPERYGGAGFTFDSQAIVFEEMGAALMCSPYLSTFLAAEALLASGDEPACAGHLPAIASGKTRASLAFLEADAQLDAGGVRVRATPVGGGEYRLDGEKLFVLDGHTAQLLVVAARTENGVSLFLVNDDAEGLVRECLPTIDATRKQARVRFASVPAQLLGTDGEGWSALSRTLDRAAAAVAAEQVGGASSCLAMAVAYAKDRVQFGQPIGAFQAVKHKCAEMLRRTELARAAAQQAARVLSRDAVDAPKVASIARVYCSEAYSWVATENIHVHGGIGFTWEHPAHLYYRRAKASEHLFGSPDHHREIVLQRMGV